MCTDVDNQATDMNGNGCSYYDENRQKCGNYDVNTDAMVFDAKTMCCACKGGEMPGKSPNTIFFTINFLKQTTIV